ncbi:MAG: alpha/beta hydrolase [Pyrinomonadaceae bacterium]|nr:alpha/beta hydrolase [Pyrinomonadaceae bacterium]
MLGRLIHARERHYSQRDRNRVVRPFEWGTEFIREHVNGDDPRAIFEQHAEEGLSHSEDFYFPPDIKDFQLADNVLTWTSAVLTPSPVNNTARARFFPAPESKAKNRRAVLVLPQWNAQPESHIELCHVLNRLGISALRLTMPYHEERRPAELERAEHLVSSNIGRTIQSVRQAVLDARAAARWLIEHQSYDRVGIIGTSIGSCTAFLTFAHEERISVGVFNHVSGYFADVVWRGISTQHVRNGFRDEVTLEELRRYWLPISPLPFIPRLLKQKPRPMRFIAARYDLTFPVDLSRDVIRETQRHGIPVDVAWLPCGHYTSGEKPWVYLDGWKIATFFRKHL